MDNQAESNKSNSDSSNTHIREAHDAKQKIVETELNGSSSDMCRDSSSLLQETACLLGREAQSILYAAPRSAIEAERYFLNIYQEAFRSAGEKKSAKRSQSATKGSLGPKKRLFAVFCLYVIAPWGKGEANSSLLPQWCAAKQLSSSESADFLSFVKEFEAWEPAQEEDYALIITLDRAIVRGARVGASSLNVESFYDWLSRNYSNLGDGAKYFAETRALLEVAGGLEDGHKLNGAAPAKKIKNIARIVLREVGRKYGRSGLNSVRRQVGAPPAARRPSQLALGADYSKRVYELMEQYMHLELSEREAFKCVLAKVDTESP